MANMILAAVLVWLAVAQVVALAAVLTRHAIPRAPTVFGAMLFFPMVAAAASALVMAYIAASTSVGEPSAFFGLTLRPCLAVFVASEAMWISVLVAYSFYHFVHGRYQGPPDGGPDG